MLVPTNVLFKSRTDQIEQRLKQDKLKLTWIQELLAQRQCLVPYMSLRCFVIRKGWLGKKLPDNGACGGPVPGKLSRRISDAWG